MIKIIKGTYGVERLTSKSGPFSLSAEQEKRLVDLGVAKYVTTPEAPEAQEQAEAPAKAEKKTADKTGKAKAAKKK